MTPQKQLFLHNPPVTYGDCARTCLACLLDLSPEEVPNFAELHWEDKAAFDQAEANFLTAHGLKRVQFGYESELQDVLNYMREANRGTYYILLGTSANGTPHDVIGLDDSIIWDPSIDNSGIVAPIEETGAYYISVFVPTRLTASERGAA